jgi:AraC-like DNA-binding protein
VRLQEAARQFVVEGEAGASEIAARLGFTDQAHLVNEFRVATGLTPGSYAESLRKPFQS